MVAFNSQLTDFLKFKDQLQHIAGPDQQNEKPRKGPRRKRVSQGLTLQSALARAQPHCHLLEKEPTVLMDYQNEHVHNFEGTEKICLLGEKMDKFYFQSIEKEKQLP